MPNQEDGRKQGKNYVARFLSLMWLGISFPNNPWSRLSYIMIGAYIKIVVGRTRSNIVDDINILASWAVHDCSAARCNNCRLSHFSMRTKAWNRTFLPFAPPNRLQWRPRGNLVVFVKLTDIIGSGCAWSLLSTPFKSIAYFSKESLSHIFDEFTCSYILSSYGFNQKAESCPKRIKTNVL